jgi:putative endonuclease
VESPSEVGFRGEDQAVAYLRSKGYEILCRNYRYRKAEIDIIARMGSILAIVEVKTRTLGFYGDPADSIPKSKIQRLVAAADHYASSGEVDYEIRFDLVYVLRSGSGYQLAHVEDAFYYF